MKIAHKLLNNPLFTKLQHAYNYRHFFITIVKKEFKVRYAQSYLGITWIVLEPLFLVLTLSFIFTAIGRKAPGGHPFALYFYSGLLPWNYFISSFVQGTNVFVKDANLIKKIFYPREISVSINVAVNFIDFGFANIAFIVLLIIYQISPNWNYLYLPILLLLQTLFAYSLSLVFGSINVFVRDIGIIVKTLRTLWFWFTPIIFDYPFSGRTKFLYYVNPMAGIIKNYRNIILDNTPPVIQQLLSVTIAIVVFFIVGIIIFKRLEKEFVDVL